MRRWATTVRVLVAAAMLYAGAPTLLAQSDADATAPAFSLSSSEVHDHARPRGGVAHLPPRAAPRLPRLQGERPVGVLRGLEGPASDSAPTNRSPCRRNPRWIERIAAWKRRQRGAIRNFLRGQVTTDYRRGSARGDRHHPGVAARDAQGEHLRAGAAAQPRAGGHLLARAAARTTATPKCVACRSTCAGAGIYVVEAVNDLLRAYTIVIVSDVGARHQDLARTDAVLRRQPLHRRAARADATCA